MIWVIEIFDFDANEWVADVENYLNRKAARQSARAYVNKKTRIRKYIRAE